MIEASELRIGNYLFDAKERLCEVMKIEITEDREFYAGAVYGGITSLPNKPIPLTEEWLIKLGLKKLKPWLYSFPNSSELLLWSNRNEEFNHTEKNYFSFALIEEERGQRLFGKMVVYVHELQNTFFALKGEELIYKP